MSKCIDCKCALATVPASDPELCSDCHAERYPSDATPTTINIVRQGRPLVDSAYICAAGEDVVAIDIDMRTKRGLVSYFTLCDDIPGIGIDINEESLKYDEDKEGETQVDFLDYKGWRVHSADYSRYTVAVCLVRM